ncbi:N-acyl homoserine lactonase family protein [Methylorubrum thiocyanatum]|uniref:N-acyl homoserine lactonase family protein n=1 Tax=Methylorubrum thiocyanatum TaxID=47958 RepID=UPI003F7DAE03
MNNINSSQLFALRYATQGKRRAQDCLIGPRPDDLDQDFDYFFWLIAGPSPIVIDCGFDDRTSATANLHLLHHPGHLLQSVGVDPRDVKTVILTHLHYDHAGCLDLFPSATFIVQAAEVAHATGPAMGHEPLRRYYRREHIQSIIGASFEGRLKQVEGDFVLNSETSLHLVPGHTPGQQVVKFSSGGSNLVFASDALHLGLNLHRRSPFPIVDNLFESYNAFDKLISLAGRANRIVAGHDPHFSLATDALPTTIDAIRLHPGE